MYTRPKRAHEMTFAELKDRANHWTADEEILKAYMHALEDRVMALELAPEGYEIMLQQANRTST